VPRLAMLLSIVLVALGSTLPAVAGENPPPASCQHHNAVGQCVVSVVTPGATDPGATGITVAQESCRDLLGDPIPCNDPGLGYWDASLGCYLLYESPQPPLSSPIWQGHTDGAIYLCTSWPATTTGTADLWFPAPPAVGPAAAALRAEKAITLQRPSGHRSPNEAQTRDGHPYTYVNLWTWFWTDRSTWRTRSATARAGGVSATVRVTPKALLFDPGDGSAVVVCSGPGRAWTSADGNDPPTSGGCGYRYQTATRSPITSTQSIEWSVTWSASDGTSGALPDITTSQSGELMVLQIESVVSR
jgi:hypothetical protein